MHTQRSSQQSPKALVASWAGREGRADRFLEHTSLSVVFQLAVRFATCPKNLRQGGVFYVHRPIYPHQTVVDEHERVGVCEFWSQNEGHLFLASIQHVYLDVFSFRLTTHLLTVGLFVYIRSNRGVRCAKHKIINADALCHASTPMKTTTESLVHGVESTATRTPFGASPSIRPAASSVVIRDGTTYAWFPFPAGATALSLQPCDLGKADTQQ